MNEWTVLITIGLLLGLNVFTLVLNQHERNKGMERELMLVKALAAENIQELHYAEESPADIRKRMKIEGDLSVKAEKLEEWKAAREEQHGNVDGVKPGSAADHVTVQ